MKKKDARHLPPDEQERRRREAIRLRSEGVGNAETARLVGLSPQTVSTLWNRWLREGDAALLSRKRGKRKGAGTRLDREEEIVLLKKMIHDDPRSLELAATLNAARLNSPTLAGLLSLRLWSREAVGALIEKITGNSLPPNTLNDYLDSWGIRPGRSLKREIERRYGATASDFGARLYRARRHTKILNAELWWLDISGTVPLGRHFTRNEIVRIMPDGPPSEPLLLRTSGPGGRVLFTLCRMESKYGCFKEMVMRLIDSLPHGKNALLALSDTLNGCGEKLAEERNEIVMRRARIINFS